MTLVYIHMYLFCWVGFPELNQDDQLILIKCGFFEVWLTRMARMFNKAEGCLTFEDGSIIQKEELGVVFSVSIWPQENCWVQYCSNVWENCSLFAAYLCSSSRRLRADWFLVCLTCYLSLFCLQFSYNHMFW